MRNRTYNDELLVLAHYMGFFIEWKYQQAMESSVFTYVGYNGIRVMTNLFDHWGNKIEPISLRQYKEWNDEHAAFEISVQKAVREVKLETGLDFVINY